MNKKFYAKVAEVDTADEANKWIAEGWDLLEEAGGKTPDGRPIILWGLGLPKNKTED